MNILDLKKIIIPCVMATTVVSAFAEWTYVAENAKDNFYIDYDTIRKDGNLRKFWLVHNFNQKERGAMSIRSREEIDCKEEHGRTLSLSAHSESMANGKKIMEEFSPEDPWRDRPPGSVGSIILKTVCAK